VRTRAPVRHRRQGNQRRSPSRLSAGSRVAEVREEVYPDEDNDSDTRTSSSEVVDVRDRAGEVRSGSTITAEAMDAASKSQDGPGNNAPAEEATDAGTPARPAEAQKRPRNLGVDVARGFALVGMISVHTYPYVWEDGTQSVPSMVAGGRAAATFALLAGVGIALLSGARRPVEGRARAPVRAGLAVRGLLLVVIGFALGYLDSDVQVILTYFGLFFIFAIPLIGLRARVLWIAAIAIAVLMPVLYHLTTDYLPEPSFDINPTIGSLFEDPVGLLIALSITGAYPALAWMAFVCAGMAAGRMQLSSARVAGRLLIAGLLLGAAAWGISSLLLHPLGGLDRLMANVPEGMSRATVHDWANHESEAWTLPTWSWWWLAIRSPHSTAPLDLLHVMGAALALLGGMVLLTRVSIAARVLTPLALAGGMTLTLYSAHVVVMSTSLLGDHYAALLLVQLIGGLLFAVLWRRKFARGPLEAVLHAGATWARRAVTEYQGPPLIVRSAASRVSPRLRRRAAPSGVSAESGRGRHGSP
jgi:uncharacterized membrane protein YeiB